MKPILRTKSIGTKVTEEEYARLEALARASGRNMSKWVRDVLLAELESRAAQGTDTTVLAELLGLRTILLNLLFTVAKGEVMMPRRRNCRRKSRCSDSQWGRKVYQSWASRHPVWTRSAFFGRPVVSCSRSARAPADDV